MCGVVTRARSKQAASPTVFEEPGLVQPDPDLVLPAPVMSQSAAQDTITAHTEAGCTINHYSLCHLQLAGR